MQLVVSAVVLLLGLAGPAVGDELQLVEDAEFTKLITDEKFVVALFCSQQNTERCEEFEGELTGIREAPS